MGYIKFNLVANPSLVVTNEMDTRVREVLSGPDEPRRDDAYVAFETPQDIAQIEDWDRYSLEYQKFKDEISALPAIDRVYDDSYGVNAYVRSNASLKNALEQLKPIFDRHGGTPSDIYTQPVQYTLDTYDDVLPFIKKNLHRLPEFSIQRAQGFDPTTFMPTE